MEEKRSSRNIFSKTNFTKEDISIKQELKDPGKGHIINNHKNTGSSYLLVGAGIVLFIISISLRNSLSNFFINPSTVRFSSLQLFYGYPPNGEIAVFREYFLPLFKNFTLSYFLSALVFIAGLSAVLWGLKGIMGEKKPGFIDGIINFSRSKTVVFCVILFFAVFILLVFLQRTYIGDNFTSLDEFSYLFQSHVLLKGKLFLDSPAPVDSFHFSNIINNGKWFSKYTVGFPLLLCMGVILKMPWIVNCVLGGLAVVMIFLAGREIYDEKTGLFAAILLILSPVFTLNGMALFPHIPHLVFILLFTLFFFRSIKENGKWFDCVLSGFSLGFSILIRPAESVLIALLFLLCGIILIAGDKSRRSSLLKAFAITAVSFACMMGVILLVNKIQTGSFMTFAFNIYNKGEKVGLGTYQHSLLKGLWNSLFSVSRLFIWISILGIELAVISLFEKKWENRFLFSLVITSIIFYFFYYTTGEVEYGPRYYFAMLGFLLILAARGIVYLDHVLKEKWNISNFAPVYIIFAVVFSVIAQYPPVLRSAFHHTRSISHYQVKTMAERRMPENEKAVVFVRSNPDSTAFAYTSNLPNLDDRILYLVFLDPDTNKEVRKKYPKRHFYILDFNRSQGGFILRDDYNVAFEKRADNLKTEDLIFAALNYSTSVKKPAEALKLLDEALKFSPGNPMILIRKAGVMMNTGDFQGALGVLNKIIDDNPGMVGVYFVRGLCLEKMGKKKEAAESFRRFLKASPRDDNAKRAYYWLEYLSK